MSTAYLSSGCSPRAICTCRETRDSARDIFRLGSWYLPPNFPHARPGISHQANNQTRQQDSGSSIRVKFSSPLSHPPITDHVVHILPSRP
ncbi:unnamed protein product [Diplocarpon coronariae]